jgi:hypothetical protein
MKALGLAIVGVGCALLVSCGSKAPNPGDGAGPPKGSAPRPRELIVGKWEMPADKTGYSEIMEFTADGKAITQAISKVETTTLENTYQFPDDQTVQLYEKNNPTARYKVEVTKTELTLIDTKNNEVNKYRRVP